MKRVLFLILAVLCLSVGCSQEDATDLWSENIYPSTNNTYDIGSPTLQYQDGYFVNVWASNNVTATNNMTASYFIGDGSLLTGIEQGELILYFLNTDSPDVAGADRLSSIYNTSEVTLAGAGLADGNTLMGTWITDTNVPNIRILEGNMRVHVTGKKTGGTKNAQFYYEVWKCNATGTDIELVSTSEYSDILTNVRVDYRMWALADETSFNYSDRIKIRGYAYVTGGGSAPTVEAYIQGASNTRIIIPVGGISIERFMPYTNAVSNLVTTYNITASYFIGNGSYLTGSWSLGNFSNVNILNGGHLWVWDADNSDNFHLSHDGGVGIIENPTGDIYIRGDDHVVVDLTGDAAGMYEFQVENSGNNKVASIDTAGNLDVIGYMANANMTIRADGTIAPVSMANASAPNNSIFFSTGSNTLCYKDSLGNTYSLY